MTNDEARTLLKPADVVALTMYGEARGESIEGRVAVGCVIRNRVLKRHQGADTFTEVCWARLQFSCWNVNDPNSQMLWTAARSLASGIRIVDLLLLETHFLAEGIVGGQLRDITNGATHYYAPRAMVPPGRVPDWAKNVAPIARVGGHLFFKGV